MTSRTQGRGGFTLIEIIVAIAVISILAAALTPAVLGYIKKARTQSVVEDVKAIQLAMSQYYADVGSFTPLRDIRNFSTSQRSPAFRHFIRGDGQQGWDGPYMSRVKVNSEAGGTFDIDVSSADQAVINLGSRKALGGSYTAVLTAVNDALDGDRDTRRGIVWGDAKGIHVGVNTFKK